MTIDETAFSRDETTRETIGDETALWGRVARAIADGLRIADGERVSVFLTDVNAFPLLESLCREVYRRGAVPHVVLTDERIDAIAVAESRPEQLAVPAPVELYSLESSDVHVSLRGLVPPSTASGPGLADRVAAQRRAKGIISTARWKETRWAVVRVPTRAWAEFAGLDHGVLLREFTDGCLFDWDGARPVWDALARELEETDVVTIRSSDTELRLPVRGRRAVVFAGEANWPDGEVATAPLDDGAEGHILFPGSLYFASREVRNLRLEFEAGSVVRADADEGADLVTALLDTDAGSRRVGELGIGLNPLIQTPTGDLFFDEKILGTVHLALGRAYPECGGTNESSLHWDIVKDLRRTAPGGPGTLLFDGRPVIRDGVPTWQSL